MSRARKVARVSLTQRWRVALANAGINQVEWANRNGWTEGHVSQVISGKRESAAVVTAALVFIDEQERLIAQRAGRPAA